MAKKKTSIDEQDNDILDASEEQHYDVAELDDSAFDDDWDDDADLGDEWDDVPKRSSTSKKTAKSVGKAKEEEKTEDIEDGIGYEVEDHSDDFEDDFEDEDFGDVEEQAPETYDVPDGDGETYDVPEDEPETYDVPDGEAESFDVPEDEPETYDVPGEEEQQSAAMQDDVADELDVSAPALETQDVQEAEDAEEIDVVIPAQEVEQVQEGKQEEEITQPVITDEEQQQSSTDEARVVEQEEPVKEQTAEEQVEEQIDEQPAEEQTATAQVDEETAVDVDVPVDENASEQEENVEDIVVPEEEDKSDEEREREEKELEEYRSMMGDSNAEMADVSAYRNFRRKTKTEPKSSKPKKSDFDLFANRYKVKTMNATVAATDPIIYFYNACIKRNGHIMLFNVYQVLQDRFLGKMVPQLFTAVAEGSTKIDELNEANLLAQLPICAEFPEYQFIISMSAHCFIKPALLERFLKLLPEEGVPNLVLAFDCAALQSIANAAKTGLGTIRAHGLKVMLDNTERVTMDVLSELDYDYLRIDARYYEMDNPRAEAYLRLILALAHEQGIGTVATFCDTEDMADYMLFMGVDAVQGNAISRPMRTVPNSVKAITLLPSMLEAPDDEDGGGIPK